MRTNKVRSSRLLFFYVLLCSGILPAQDLIEGYRFTDVRTGQTLRMPMVNSEQVEGYEILYATPGTGDIAEIAGHLLLRVQLRDVPEDQDLVISFLADTGPLPKTGSAAPVLTECRNRNWFNLIQSPSPNQESPWASISQSIRGLIGGLPVTMDIQTFAYTLKSYTVEQDRNLLRYRLNLDDAQRKSLTTYLIERKNRPMPNYYFFHQNCGSVLVQVVGEGIEEASIANFRPWVSPPHSLCALLCREGLAERVYPDFHSTRAKGDLYQRWFKKKYPEYTSRWPDVPWPDVSAFLDKNISERLFAIRQLEGVVFEDPNTLPLVLSLGPVLQQMELATDVRGGLCRDLTSEATTAARELQRTLMEQYPDNLPVDLFQSGHPLQAPPPPGSGSMHTRLFAMEAGVAWLDDRPGAWLSGVLLQQEMGSRSNLAMQRAGALILGRATILLDEDTVQEWGFTGLSLRKFRERLGKVPSGLTSSDGWGMGLKVLELNSKTIGPELDGRLAGISGWVNLLSSEDNRNFIMMGAGLDAGWHHGQQFGTDWGALFPLGIESLVSIGSVKWRNTAAWIPNTLTDSPIQLSASSVLEIPLGEWGKTEVILRTGLDSRWIGNDQRTLGTCVLEFNRW